MSSFKLAVAGAAVAASFAAAAFAQDRAQQERADALVIRQIAVEGEGRVFAEPDEARLNIGVVAQGDTAAAALAANNRAMNAAIAALREASVAERDIQTSNLSINPRYDYDQRRSNPPIIGYEANNQVTVRIRDVDSLGAVIDAATAAGSNQMNGLSFTFADPSALMLDARERAVKDAQARAERLADAAGVSLGRVLTISDGAAPMPIGPQPVMRQAMDMAESAATSVQRGENELTARVRVVFEIR